MNTLSGEQFFLQKEGEVLIFATHINMHLLAEATTIYVDGMFEICLRLFYQVFTINANSSHLCMGYYLANQEMYTISSSWV